MLSSSTERGLSEDAEAMLTTACREVFAERPGLKTEESQIKAVNFTRKKLVQNGFCTPSQFRSISLDAWKQMGLPPPLYDKMRLLLSVETSTQSSSASDMVAALPAGFALGTSHPATAMLTENLDAGDAMLELQTPPAAYGRNGYSISLVVNHFELKVVGEPRRRIWVMWQLEFPPFVPPNRTAAGAPGSAKHAAGVFREPREPGRELRRQAVAKLLQHIDAADWLYDGRYRLYTIKAGRTEAPFESNTVEIDGSRGGKLSIQVNIIPAVDQSKQPHVQQELDLRRISTATRQEDASEELRFVAVAMRCHAMENEKLAVVGRRIVCPGIPLDSSGEMSLKHGRELWMGYLAQANLVASRTGMRCTLSLNLVASVGVPRIDAIDLVARFLSKGRTDNFEWYSKELRKNKWLRELNSQMLETLNSETGLRKLRVCTHYFGHERKSSIVGITTQTSANTQKFEFKGKMITVADYFKYERDVILKLPDLPCLELGKPKNYVPIELVEVLGGEQNILVGKLRPEYQADVVRRAAMLPSLRRDAITGVMEHVGIGPRAALKEKGIDAQHGMINVTGHVLDAPRIDHGAGSHIKPNNYAREVTAIAPPEYEVQWGLWYATDAKWWDMEQFAGEFARNAKQRGIRFSLHLFVQQPQHWWKSYYGSDDEREGAIRADLREVLKTYPLLSLLVVVLPDDNHGKHLRGHLKTITEIDFGGRFATQCIKEARNLSNKLHTLMMKVPGKLPRRYVDNVGHGASHYVNLHEPHLLLAKRRVMVIGADVTHNAAGVSVAGVVATQDQTYVTYFSELRGQTPFVLEGEKSRRRKSEERIIELTAMVSAMLGRWRRTNDDHLPDVIFYYRDGVSNGQFFDVLSRERNQLAEAFERIGGHGYSPELAIIVGQKRHQTRLFRQTAGKGKAQSGKSGAKNDPAQVPPGTVAGDGIATPGHLNFYLVAHEGIQGTSVPCHYHVLHLDERLRIGIDDLERITYDLCHLYPRADKTVSYVTPTYLADHLCERGKLYLETHFHDSGDAASVAASSTSSDQEERIRQMIQTRVDWLNDKQAELSDNGWDLAQGRNYFC
mmetsp:Transcript_145336/g.264473  ORF Transcript_145336/g.264473 Transcript_145336/m.264473 type:complete len:1073 (-) Transcript_145336:107-3325(-)